MFRVNESYLQLPGSYLFAEIARRVKEYQQANPDRDLVRLGIGDVTQPLVPAVINAMHKGVEEMGHRETFHGYGPDYGYDFLIQANNDFRKKLAVEGNAHSHTVLCVPCPLRRIVCIFTEACRIAGKGVEVLEVLREERIHAVGLRAGKPLPHCNFQLLNEVLHLLAVVHPPQIPEPDFTVGDDYIDNRLWVPAGFTNQTRTYQTSCQSGDNDRW